MSVMSEIVWMKFVGLIFFLILKRIFMKELQNIVLIYGFHENENLKWFC